MTRIAFINPNATEVMTQTCHAAFATYLPDGYEAVAITNEMGPPAIQGHKDGEAAIPGLLEIIAKSDYDAYIIACFDDTGLEQARQITKSPVIGIGQASFHYAALRSGRFNVLTTLAVSIPVISENIGNQGFSGVCNGVYASGVPVLELEHNPDASRQIVASHIQRLTKKEPDIAVILGCAGMTNIWQKLQADFSTPLVDPVAAAAKLIVPLLAD
jgi:allantoin racemase